MTDFAPDPILEKKNNASKTFICTQCGECCHIREKKGISEHEEQSYYKFMYSNYGILYLASLNDITINIWPEEKDIMLEAAKRLNIEIDIKPKRAVLNHKTNELLIIDYFINHDICPFFKAHKCSIYEARPMICRSYPLLSSKNLGKCRYKKPDPDHYDLEKPVAIMLEHKTIALKHLLKQMINEGIILNKPIPSEDLKEMLNNATAKDMLIRIDKK